MNDVDWRKGPRFNQTALAGLGVPLASAVLVDADLATGKLVRLASDELRGDFAHYPVHPHDKASLPSLKQFKAWCAPRFDFSGL